MTKKKKITLITGIIIFLILALGSVATKFFVSASSVKNKKIEMPVYQNTPQVLQEKEEIRNKLIEYEDIHIDGLKIIAQGLEDSDTLSVHSQARKSIQDVTAILADLETQNWGNTDDENFNKAVKELHQDAVTAYQYKLEFLEICAVWSQENPGKNLLKIINLSTKMADYWEYFIKKENIYLDNTEK